MTTAHGTRMEIREFRPSDIRAMTVQDAQLGDQAILSMMSNEDWQQAQDIGIARTGVKGSIIIGSAGLMNVWEGRAIAWALLSKRVHRYDMIFIHRWVKCFLDRCERRWNLRRIETPIRCDFPQGVRWAEMLGFQCEGTMRRYDPQGMDTFLYARVR